MNKKSSLNNQSGVVLVISLIMLMLLTLIGITGTQVTSLEEKMASNTRDQNLAFQAAESALREGEALLSPDILSSTSYDFVIIDTVFNGTNGFLLRKTDTAPLFTDDIWANNAKTLEFDTGDSKIATQPRYFIKHLTTKVANTDASINIGNGYGGAAAALDVDYFVVTARGTGAQDSSQIFLQSYYAIKPAQ